MPGIAEATIQRLSTSIRSLRGRGRALVGFALAVHVMWLLVFVPLAATFLNLFLKRWGRPSVGNFELVSFSASPVGLAAILSVLVVSLAAVYLDLAGLMWLIDRPSARVLGTFRVLAWKLPDLARLGFRQLLALLVLALPFLGGIALAHRLLWAGRDIYGLLVLKPPVFWLGAGIAGVLVAAHAAIATWLMARWSLATPALLFEPGTSVGRALDLSVERTRGRLALLVTTFLGWLVLETAIGWAALGGLRWGSGLVLNRLGGSFTLAAAVTGVLLAAHALLATAVSILGSVGLAALAWTFHREAVPAASNSDAEERTAREPGPWRLVALGTLGILGALATLRMVTTLDISERVGITAHRGASFDAPENTVAAVRKAAELGADWAEIDVQRTRDGALVVMHDVDLTRVGGGNRHVGATPLAAIQALDFGSTFGPEFRGERIPTLDQVMDAARDRVRLTIELKPHGPSDVAPLVGLVIDAIERAGFEGQCRICSQSYEALQLARERLPDLEVGFIAGAAVGDLSRLNVNFLMVNGPLATRKLVDAAALRGIRVHAWTINDPDQLLVYLDRGVANIITDDPRAMRERLREIRALEPTQRLLLRARNLLAD